MNNLKIIIRKLSCLLVFLPFMTAPLFVAAQNQFNLNDLGDGQLILNLNATEQASVEQDTLNVFMQYSSQGRNSTTLQDEVNKVMRTAREILEDTDNIDWSIQQYHVYTITPRNPQTRNELENPLWRAQQGIQMKSMNSEALLVVTARLQQAGLAINNLFYSLSPEKYAETSDLLTNVALKGLQTRAEEIAQTLDKGRAALVEVSVNDSQNFPGPRMMMAESTRAGDVAMNVPVAAPGETQVSVTISARALLSP